MPGRESVRGMCGCGCGRSSGVSNLKNSLLSDFINSTQLSVKLVHDANNTVHSSFSRGKKSKTSSPFLNLVVSVSCD